MGAVAPDTSTGPAIVLVRPQLGENIGKAARAMLNFGLTDMRLVAPRDGWPNESARPAASGADSVLDQARVFTCVADAVADCAHVYASTVRSRAMSKPVVTAEEAAVHMATAASGGGRSAVLFGRESAGLDNDEVSHADRVLTVPVNPAFGSLNLAQAVILVAYDVSRHRRDLAATPGASEREVATKDELDGLMAHLEAELVPRGFYRSVDRRDTQRRMLRNLLQSGRFTRQEVQTWRGIIKTLVRPRPER
ncbi:RNA methyltransferase [Yunchengibacter salinarum]|uniref:RNA methyltransferase n=1 Tax=Yunchengibacter salinarum TaxID=3133399 RepID=UPI0035B59153